MRALTGYINRRRALRQSSAALLSCSETSAVAASCCFKKKKTHLNAAQCIISTVTLSVQPGLHLQTWGPLTIIFYHICIFFLFFFFFLNKCAIRSGAVWIRLLATRPTSSRFITRFSFAPLFVCSPGQLGCERAQLFCIRVAWRKETPPQAKLESAALSSSVSIQQQTGRKMSSYAPIYVVFKRTNGLVTH